MTDQKAEGRHHYTRGSEGPCGRITQQYSGYIGRGTRYQAQAQCGSWPISTHSKAQSERTRAHVGGQVSHIGMQPSGREQAPPLSVLTKGRHLDPTGRTKRHWQQRMNRAQHEDPGHRRGIPRQGTRRDGGAVPGKAAVFAAIFQNHSPRSFQCIGLDPQTPSGTANTLR